VDEQPKKQAEKARKNLLTNLFFGEFPQKQMARFAQQTPINAAVTLAVVLLAAAILLPVVPLLQVLGWALVQGALLSTIFFRWWRRRGSSRPPSSDKEVSRRALRHGLIFAALSGGLWGSLTFFMPGLPETHRVGVFLVQGGMAAGAAATLAAMPGAAFLFILGCMLPPILYLLSYGEMPFVGLALMLITFTVAMLGTSRLLLQTMLEQQTAERGQEKAVEESASILRLFERAREEWLAVAGAGPGFALFDQAGSLLVWNDKFCDVLSLPGSSLQRGRTRSAVLVDAARPIGSKLGAKGGETWYDDLLNLQESDGILAAELPGGRLVEVSARSMDGGFEVIIARDVTERKKAENSLRLSEARLKSTQRVARIGSWIRDQKTRQLQWSDELYEMFGLEPQSVAPDRDYFERLVHEDDIDAVRETVARGLSGQEQGELEFRLYRVDGDLRHFRVRGELILDQEGQTSLALATFQDITDLRRAQADLAHAQKLEAVGQLTGGIAHDFNNLLLVVIGNLELAEEMLAADEVERDRIVALLGRAQEAAEGGSALTTRLLAFSRKQELRPVWIDVNDLLGGMAHLLRRAVGEAIVIECDLDETINAVCVDPPQLENAILNLFLNAKDAMPDGGTVRLETRNVPAGALDAGLDLDPVDHISISVADVGGGISEKLRERIFEPFFTTKEVGKGSGLGLSMVHGFARQSGGNVEITNNEDRGATATIFLKAEECGDTACLPKPIDDKELPLGDECILVVEDSDALRELAEQILTGLGYSVLMAEDGPSAMELVDAGAEFDLLFTDVVLPKGMDGVEVVEKITALRPGMKVLYTSGYTREAVAEGRISEEAELLTKPYRRAQVAAMVRKVLDA
jgi:PAS domain S-box-containing protein